MIWAAQFTAPRTAGLLWALATALKWVPIVLLPLLAPRGRAWGAIFLAIAGVLTLVTLPGTLVQLQVLFAFPAGARRLPGLPVGARAVAVARSGPRPPAAPVDLARRGTRLDC